MHTVSKHEVRPLSAAGLFYPADPVKLSRQIDTFLERADTEKPAGTIRGIISPHAGYAYSGQVAAAGYSCLQGLHFDVILVISPSHNESFPGVSVFTGKGYESPGGLVPIEAEFSNALVKSCPLIHSSWQGHRNEHALEVQLPFLKKTLDYFELVPIVMGEQNLDTAVALGQALAEVLEGVSALIVASSDLSHRFPYPVACALDHTAAEIIEACDENRFVEALEKGECQACGWGPIISALVACKYEGADSVRVCQYQNSGDVTGDHSSVVGYLSALLYNDRIEHRR